MEVVEGKGYMVTVLSRKVPGYTMENSEVKQELKRLQRSSAGGSVTQELRSRGLAGMKVNLFDSPGN